ncbi:Transamidase GatB domain protein [hydrothermal vent metagenome]|uniref:Transamidase GatB domain protein n=1 Tax=hydrothermal vent metagenome TaxID=652676 RepID=A0A3B1CG40_9ZZZZ|nr:GatB/YqeY domain-containing protein [Candidatus Manganitrophaceae bacterium]
MGLKEQLKSDMKTAMRSRDQERVSVIRLLISTIKNKEIEKGKDVVLSDDDVLALIVTAAKQRRESITQFKDAGRDELAEKESRELQILSSYLPEPLSEEALREKVKAAIAATGITEMKDMGQVMKTLVPALRGRAEGDAIRRMLQSCL